MQDGSDAFLLPRSSMDSPISSAASLSDYWDDKIPDYKLSRRRKPASRIKSFVHSLTHRPLGLRTRRKSPCRKTRLAVCAFNLFAVLAVLYFTVTIGQSILYPSYANPPAHYQELDRRIANTTESGRGNPRREKVFIAANIIQHELIRGAWGDSVIELIDHLGPENVFVSIYENDSGSETEAALAEFRDRLKCEYSIVYGDHLPLDNFPSVVLPNGESRIKRITYLSEVRNRLLKPLDDRPTYIDSQILSINYTSTRFDRLLFLNDIYFNPTDAVHLLFSTNQNPETGLAEYQAACALDFIRGGTLYDSFVIRDTDGYEISWFLYPWFTNKGSGASRRDVIAQKDAVRVRSCWSGMAAYEATPFLRNDLRSQSFLNQTYNSPAVIHQSHMDVVESSPPLRFRAQSELFWEASECCLINADILARYPGIETQMFVNPYVRVAYKPGTWRWQPILQRFERVLSPLQTVVSWLGLKPENNPRRAEVVGKVATLRRWLYDRADLNGQKMRDLSAQPVAEGELTGRWTTVEELATPGGYCGQKRLFVMKSDLQKANMGDTGKNWEAMPIP